MRSKLFLFSTIIFCEEIKGRAKVAESLFREAGMTKQQARTNVQQMLNAETECCCTPGYPPL